MFFNRYVFIIFIAALASVSSLYIVLTRLDPFVDETLAVALFFVSLFFSVSALSTLAGYAIRIVFYSNELFLNHFNVSLRQGLILGFCICALMGFQVLGTLTWWNGLIIVIISFLVELYFVAKE